MIPHWWHIVKCQACGTTFDKRIWIDQAADCAARLHEGIVYGHYGSEFDTQIYKWVGSEAPSDMDPVCEVRPNVDR